jgi:cytochrome oxidase Cu insertion factor (SCO1/SenC/PrrC family)
MCKSIRSQVLALSLAVIVVAALACGGAQPATSPFQPTPTASSDAVSTPIPTPTQKLGLSTGPEVGNLAPSFVVRSLDGNIVTLEDVRAGGRPFILFFFATW